MSPAPSGLAQCWRITRLPFTAVYQGFACRVTPMLCSDLCTQAGSSGMPRRVSPSLSNTCIIIYNQMFHFSMHTEGKQQHMCVFLHCYFSLCHPQLQGHSSIQPLCSEPVPHNSCSISERRPPWGCINQRHKSVHGRGQEECI